ncbi:MAG: hypothetical protein U0694_13050 [Anaerolineae bacterium]
MSAIRTPYKESLGLKVLEFIGDYGAEFSDIEVQRFLGLTDQELELAMQWMVDKQILRPEDPYEPESKVYFQ